MFSHPARTQWHCSCGSSVWPGCVYRKARTSTGSPPAHSWFSAASSFSGVKWGLWVTAARTYTNPHAQSPSVCLEGRESISSPSRVFMGPPLSENKHIMVCRCEPSERDEGATRIQGVKSPRYFFFFFVIYAAMHIDFKNDHDAFSISYFADVRSCTHRLWLELNFLFCFLRHRFSAAVSAVFYHRLSKKTVLCCVVLYIPTKTATTS